MSSGRENETAVVILSPSTPFTESSYASSNNFEAPSSAGVKALEQTLQSVIEGLGGEGKMPEGIRVIVSQEGEEEAVEEFLIANYNQKVGLLRNRASSSVLSSSSYFTPVSSSSTSSSTTNSSKVVVSISRQYLFTLERIFEKHEFGKALFLEAGMTVTHAFFEQVSRLSRVMEADKSAKTCIPSWGSSSGGGGLMFQDASSFHISDFEKTAWYVKKGLWKDYGKSWVVTVGGRGVKMGMEGNCTSSNVFRQWKRGLAEKGAEVGKGEQKEKGYRTSAYSD